MAKKKDWEKIEKSDISRNYRRLQRYLDLLRNRTEICLVHLTKETTQKNVYRYLNKNYYLVLSSEDFALMDAYHCQYQGRRLGKKHYPSVDGVTMGLHFKVSDAFGSTNIWKKKFVEETLKELKRNTTMLKKRLTVTDLRRLLQAAEKDGHGDLEVKFKVEKEGKGVHGYTITIFSIQDYSIEQIPSTEKENFYLNFFEK